MYIDENVKNEMKDMLERMQRLEREANGYYGEDKDTILYNKEKIERVYNNKKEKILEEYNSVISETIENFKNNVDTLKTKLEQEKQVLENEFNKKIEEYDNILQRLEQEKSNYSSDIEYKESVQNNIDRIEKEKEQFQKDEGKKIQDILTQKENEMNTEIEEIKAKIKDKTDQAREELKIIGIEVDEINLDDNQKEEQEEIQEHLDNEVEKDTIDEIEKTTNKPDEKEIIKTAKKDNAKEQSKYVSQGKNQIIHTNTEEQKEYDKEISNEAVRILYSAKHDKYLVTNLNNNEQKIIKRKELKKVDKEKLAEKIGKDLDNVDTNILQLLMAYDEKYKTTKASEYVEILSTIGMNKTQRQNAMKESQIDIEYNLKGLYDKHDVALWEYEDNFSKEDREELLSIANNAKQKGIATVKKGPKTALIEILGKVVNRGIKTIKQLTEGKRIALPESKREKKARENRAKNRNAKLQESENELIENEEIINKQKESEKIEKEIQDTKSTTYLEELTKMSEKFRDTYKVPENQEKNNEYFEKCEKIRENTKGKKYNVPYEWNDGNYTQVKDKDKSL